MLVRHFVLFLLESQLYEISPRFSESTQINQWKPIYVSLPLNITNIYGKYRTKRPDSPQNTLQKDSNPLYDRQKKKSMTTTESLIEYKPQNFSKEPRNPWIPINVLQTNIRNHPTSPPTPYSINKLPRKSSTPVFKPIYIGSGGAYNNWNTFGYLTTKKEKMGYLPPLPDVYTSSSTSASPRTKYFAPDKGKQNTTLTPVLIKPVFDKTIFETRTTPKATDNATNVTDQQTMSFSATSTIFGKEKNDTEIDDTLETNNVHSIFSSATTQTVVTQSTLAPIDSISLSSVFEKPTRPISVPEEQLTTSTPTRMPILIKPVFDKALFDMSTTSDSRGPSEVETKTTNKKVTMNDLNPTLCLVIVGRVPAQHVKDRLGRRPLGLLLGLARPCRLELADRKAVREGQLVARARSLDVLKFRGHAEAHAQVLEKNIYILQCHFNLLFRYHILNENCETNDI